jgi:two-component sensor histidine kinase
MTDAPTNTTGTAGWKHLAALISVLALLGGGLLPALPVTYVPMPAMAATLVAADIFGLWVGLATASVGFVTLLWRYFQLADGLTIESIIVSLLWFAVAKFAAALIARQRLRAETRDAALQASQTAVSRHQLLLAEMRHRTRNDMQRLVGVLNAEARGAPQAAPALNAAAAYVVVMSRLQERLALCGSDTGVHTLPFLQSLTEDLRSVIEPDRAIAIVAEAENHEITAGMAADLGLIVNELVTNALKHGFPDAESDRPKGVIRLSFRREGDMFALVVVDNGVGAIAVPARRGSGTALLHALAAQLGGLLSIERADVGGTRCQLNFPVAGRTALDDITRAAPVPFTRPPTADRARQAS